MTRTNVQNPPGRFIILVIVINGIPSAWMVSIPNSCWVDWIDLDSIYDPPNESSSNRGVLQPMIHCH